MKEGMKIQEEAYTRHKNRADSLPNIYFYVLHLLKLYYFPFRIRFLYLDNGNLQQFFLLLILLSAAATTLWKTFFRPGSNRDSFLFSSHLIWGSNS
jgi:hypothetical protein